MPPRHQSVCSHAHTFASRLSSSTLGGDTQVVTAGFYGPPFRLTRCITLLRNWSHTATKRNQQEGRKLYRFFPLVRNVPFSCEVKMRAIPHGHVDFKRQLSTPNSNARLLQHFCSDGFYVLFRSPVTVRLWQTILFFQVWCKCTGCWDFYLLVPCLWKNSYINENKQVRRRWLKQLESNVSLRELKNMLSSISCDLGKEMADVSEWQLTLRFMQ